MKKNSKIFVAGGTGMVGSAIITKLLKSGYNNIISNYHSRKPLAPQDSRLRLFKIDLILQSKVENFFKKERPEFVFLAAAKVGGILANNTYPAEFIYQNIMIQTNIIHCSYTYGVKKLLFLGSSCIYPKFCLQPMKEEYLLNGELEPTNEPYAIAKIAGIKMCQSYNRQYSTNYISVMPTNLYGPNDNFDLETSHVLPAMIRKFHEAKLSGGKVVLWGSGLPKREFLHVYDLADACVFLMKKYDYKDIGVFINIGTGQDISIKELSELIKDIVGYKGKVVWDKSKPDGTPRKLLDVNRLKDLGWSPRISLKDGIRITFEWYLKSFSN